MSTDTVAQIDARGAWLTVAHAVMNGDMPVPDQVNIYPEFDTPAIDVKYRAYRDNPYDDAALAAEALEIPFDRDAGDGTIRCWYRLIEGWQWNVTAYRDKPAPLDSFPVNGVHTRRQAEGGE